MLNTKALAHIRQADGKKQPLEEHLLSVSKLAGFFAKKIGLTSSGQIAGCSHDMGKYSGIFLALLSLFAQQNGQIYPDSRDFMGGNLF